VVLSGLGHVVLSGLGLLAPPMRREGWDKVDLPLLVSSGPMWVGG